MLTGIVYQDKIGVTPSRELYDVTRRGTNREGYGRLAERRIVGARRSNRKAGPEKAQERAQLWAHLPSWFLPLFHVIILLESLQPGRVGGSRHTPSYVNGHGTLLRNAPRK